MPSRLQKSALFEDVLVMRKLTRPVPVMAAVTSTSPHAPVGTLPTAPIWAPVAAGLLDQVIWVSLQPPEVGNRSPPTLLPSV